MKKILSFVVLAAVMVSCYDDSELRNLISNTKQDVVNLEDRIKDLEDWQESVNTQVENLQDLVGKAEEGKVITNVQETAEGYVLTFSDESVITVKHGAAGANGTNGTNGVDGQTPAIGVKADEDGVYYWTINGEWLYAGDNKVKAHGADGVTPKLQITEGEWHVSYDNGATWEGLGVYVGAGDSNEGSGVGSEGGNCLFQRVIPSETEVTFVFQDGSSFMIPFVTAPANLVLNFGENTSLAVIPGESATLEFTVTGAEGAVTVEYMVSESWDAELEMIAEAAGKFTVTAPAAFVVGKLVVFAADESGRVTMKTVALVEGEPEVDENDGIIFADDFSWAVGPALLHSTNGEKRFDAVTAENKPAWTTTVYTGVGSPEEPLPAAWTRDGYLRMNAAKKSSNFVTPKLDKIEGTANLVVTFRACHYQSTASPEGYHEIHVACFGPGSVDVESFSIDNLNNTSIEVASWNTLDDSIYTFNVTGATAETQIEFHFGPRRAAEEYNTNLPTPEGAPNNNTRMGFDDVVIKLAE